MNMTAQTIKLYKTIHLWMILPEIFVLMQLLVFFFAFAYLNTLKLNNKKNKYLLFYFCILCSVFSILFFVHGTFFFNPESHGPLCVANDSVNFDVTTQKIKSFLFFFCGFLTFLVGYFDLKYLKSSFKFLSFLGFCMFSLCLLFNSFKIFETILALESVSFCTYFLISSERRTVKNSLESGIKYFVVGSLASIFLFFGSSLFFYLCPTGLDYLSIREVLNNCTGPQKTLANYAFILLVLGFFFKLSIFPFHLWTPVVYDGIGSTLLVFFTLVIKFAIILYFYKISFCYFLPLVQELRFFFYACALLSIVAGVLGASLQVRIQKMLGYSSINFMGYFLTIFFCEPSYAFSVNLYNFFVYSISFLGFFSFLVRYLSINSFEKVEVFSQFIYLGNSTKHCGWPLAVFLLSMGGVPPFPGFFSKLLVLSSLAFSQYFFFFLIASAANILTYYYSLRIVKMLFFLELQKSGPIYIYYGTDFFKLFTFFVLCLLLLFFDMFFFLELFFKFWICLVFN